MNAHTPTPWALHRDAMRIIGNAGPAHGIAVANTFDADDAAHIVRCVNSHDALIAALRSICETTRPIDAWNAAVLARAALDAAENGDE